MSDKAILKNLIARLRKAVAEGELTEEVVKQATEKLSEIRKYDDEKFPALAGTDKFKDTSGSTPANLAEALLWKLGKWKVYKKFAAYYKAESPNPTKTDVVLFAFVKHLKDKEIPIYDQHAIRALWAICGALTEAEVRSCKSLLFDGKNKWKATGSGTDTIECYELFVRHMSTLTAANGAPSIGKMDRLLMPLGQSIKRSTNSYQEFRELCGWSTEG